MLATFQKDSFWVRLFIGFFLTLIGLAMVITLVPGPVGSVDQRGDSLAVVEGAEITTTDVRQRLNRLSSRQNIPPALEALYARELADQMIFARVLEAEAARLGIRITEQELADRIKRIVPTVFAGNAFLGRERYELEVQQRAGMTVPEFEEEIRKAMLEDKVLRLATDSYRASRAEVEEEFRKRNEKVKLDYVLLKPDSLESSVTPAEAELAAYFEKSKSQYQVPEKRSVRYALLDLFQLRLRAVPTEAELQSHYNSQLQRFRVENRARVSHILFKTVGKSDPEIEEVRKKAEDVLARLRKGAKFEDLARQHSEDSTKEKGGDLGWIVPGQTVPDFERNAFSLPLGKVSDLIKTEYGFHILRVAERENARTRPFEEVRPAIVAEVTSAKADQLAQELTDKITDAVRQSPRRPLDELAKQFSMSISETPLLAPGEMVGDISNAPEIHDEIARLKPGELSLPFRVTRGAVVFTLKQVAPAHQGILDEVRSKALENFRREKGVELARTQAESLSKRVSAGEDLAQVAKSLSLEVKASESFARNGAVTGVGSGSDFATAFEMPAGSFSKPTQIGANWVVFRVHSRDEAKPEELEKQMKDLEEQVVRAKIGLAYAEFRAELQSRMFREGRLVINEANYRRLTNGAWSHRK